MSIDKRYDNDLALAKAMAAPLDEKDIAVGMRVEKFTGEAKWHGVVVSEYQTTKGMRRFVVDVEPQGFQMIAVPSQLRPALAASPSAVDRHLCGHAEIQTYTGAVTLVAPPHMAVAFPRGICVDVCLALEITKLWAEGITTTGCCCGHGSHPTYIGVIDADIPRMKTLGYVVASNPMRPGDEDSFVPKTVLAASPSPSEMAVDDFVRQLRDFEQAYSTEFFTPLTEAEKARVGGELRSRIAADMGRHLAKFFVQAADRIEIAKAQVLRLTEENEALRKDLAAQIAGHQETARQSTDNLVKANAANARIKEAEDRAAKNWRDFRDLRLEIIGHGPMCRDCADFDGRCQGNGPPCDPDEAAKEKLAEWKSAEVRVKAIDEALNTHSREIAASSAWDFIRPKLEKIAKEGGFAGTWSNGFRSGWDAAARTALKENAL